MSVLTLAPPARPARPRGGERDRVIDLVRAASIVIVVVLHAMMAGISRSDDGTIVVANAMDHAAWFDPVSWLVQVMPLFFVAGGVSSITQWRRHRAAGVSAGSFAASRVRRLAVPALAAFAVITLGMTAASLAGAPADLLAELGFRLAQPMWFLAVYLGACAMVPLMVAAHERAPWLTMSALIAAALGVDLLRTTTAVTIVGALNLVFVWLAAQQLGFFWADGWFRARTAAQLRIAAAIAVAAIFLLIGAGVASVNMYANLNPPTVVLILLGIVQVSLLALYAERLDGWLAGSSFASAVVDAVGSRSLTIYLWHMPALMGVAAILLIGEASFPEPLGIDWWITRPLWIAGVAAATAVAVALAVRLERVGRALVIVSRGRAVVATLSAIAGVVVVLMLGFTPLTGAVAVTALASSLALARFPSAHAGATSRDS